MLIRKSDPKALVRIGMAFLLAALLSLRFLPRLKGMNHDLADGVSGLLFGVAIAVLLLSVWLRGRTSGEE